MAIHLAPRHLDLDHLGAEIGEQRARGGCGDEARQLDDADACEGGCRHGDTLAGRVTRRQVPPSTSHRLARASRPAENASDGRRHRSPPSVDARRAHRRARRRAPAARQHRRGGRPGARRRTGRGDPRLRPPRRAGGSAGRGSLRRNHPGPRGHRHRAGADRIDHARRPPEADPGARHHPRSRHIGAARPRRPLHRRGDHPPPRAGLQHPGCAGVLERSPADDGGHADPAQLHDQRAGPVLHAEAARASSASPACSCGSPSPSSRRCATGSTSRPRDLPRSTARGRAGAWRASPSGCWRSR